MAHRFFVLLASLAALALPARADDCGPLKILSTVQMRPLGRGPLMLVPVEIDRVSESLLLDTGGALSQLVPAAAYDLRLPTQPAKIRLYDLYGDSAASQVEVGHLDIGNLQASGVTMWLSPSPNGNEMFRRDFFPPLRSHYRSRLDGVLAPDLMAKYDIELDFGSNTLKYLSQDHCVGRVIYWNAPNAAVVGMQFRNLQITVPVTLDGRAMTALLDTGSPRSTITLDTARDMFGLSTDRGLTGAGRLGHTEQPYYTAQMHELSFEGVRVDNPLVNVIPDLTRKETEAGQPSHTLPLPQILLGMDVLRKLHLYIAFREQKIYITEASR